MEDIIRWDKISEDEEKISQTIIEYITGNGLRIIDNFKKYHM